MFFTYAHGAIIALVNAKAIHFKNISRHFNCRFALKLAQ